ncbi:flagellar protein FlaG [Vallitalea sp.]|jgi:flagellar protein FlaG|uniref:flagellar protein FlaG n=1 Tax=Vallitalea sp. TaxID=1882829 RepID=UPI0025D58ED5|nr:flagellar protein FlaG [Vallitalea sp.]MCT4686251.1 flagellar protein FlaG [Vallitalea sp.]
MRIECNTANMYNANSQVDMLKKEVSSSVKIEKVKDEIARDVSINIESKQQIEEHEVIEAIEKANKHFKVYDRRLKFSIHEKTKQIMVKVINTEDDSVIREIPSEKILDMVAKLWEMAGIFVDEKR